MVSLNGLARYSGQRLRSRLVLGCVALIAAITATAVTAAAQQIEFEVRTPSLDDDYLTWAPAPARIRQAPAPQNVDRVVVLTNDPERPPPAGRTLPLDGNVAFDISVGPGATASKETLQLTLPKDGSWVDFVIAGSFPRASTEDKDAVIEVHDGAATGPLLHKHAVMVRIRKNQSALTDKERARFLNAISILHRRLNGYARFVRIHEVASMGKYQQPPDYFWPDLAHRATAFLAWHRAYLLSFERELQKIDPSVALAYWRMDLLPSVFEENFMGANTVGSEAFVEPTFTVDNPLANWFVFHGPLLRFPYERRNAQDLKDRFFGDDRLFRETTFRVFARTLEGDPHNLGHNWTGPWMQNCMISPNDPVFWPFHTGFDRQWAKWQWMGGHVQPDGSNESYTPNDAYDGTVAGCNVTTPSTCVPIGHHLKDTMWPWNAAVGPGTTVKGNRPPADLSQGFTGPFPKAPIDGLWPSSPAVPTPADVIDYAGVTPARLDMGFAYDDVPFGIKPPTPVAMAENAPSASGRPTASTLLTAVNDRAQGEPVRIDALRALSVLTDGSVIMPAIQILREAGTSPELAKAAIDALSMQMMFADIDPMAHHSIRDALQNSLADNRAGVPQAALRVLAAHPDSRLVETLTGVVEGKANAALTRVDAIRGLTAAGAAGRYAAVIRPYVTGGEVDTRLAAIAALSSDPDSKPAIASVFSDRTQPEQVRSAALRSFVAGGREAPALLMDVLKRQDESQKIREQVAAALAATVESVGAQLSNTELEDLGRQLRTLGSDARLAPTLNRALEATDALRQRK